jgi:hypothetical protein
MKYQFKVGDVVEVREEWRSNPTERFLGTGVVIARLGHQPTDGEWYDVLIEGTHRAMNGQELTKVSESNEV